MRARTIFEAAGATLLLLYPHLKVPLSPYHLDIFHRQSPMNTVYGALLLWVLFVWFICWALDTLLLHFDPETKSTLWSLLLALLFYQLIVALPLPEDARSLREYLIVHLHHSKAAALFSIGFLLILMLLARLNPVTYKKTISILRIALACIGICILWILPEMLYLTLHQPVLGQTSFNHPIAPERLGRHSRRIVWVLMDELSYRLAIEAPPADTSLTNFGAFRQESYEFTRIQTPSYWTDIVLPGLMLGQPVNRIQSNPDGMLWTHTEKDGWQKFNEDKTFFADAKRAGWTTGLVGYYNPYCRILPTVLDRCAWMRENPYLAQMDPHDGLLQNTLLPLKRFALPLSAESEPDRSNTAPSKSSGEHLYLLDDQIAAANNLLRDPQINFVFLHFAVPHPPGSILHQGAHSRYQTYKENLQLADQLFGELRHQVQSSPSGGETTILLTSDHSWRTWHWRDSVFWSAADEAFSQQPGNYDERPVLMVHLPAQSTNQRVDKPMLETREFDLVEQMLYKDSFNASDMDAFLRSQ